MINVISKGNFKNTEHLFEKIKMDNYKLSVLHKFGKIGVNLLAANTPVDTGLTASSWRYQIYKDGNTMKLSFHNDNIVNGCQVAVLLQYGHATKNGGWVEGIDYINPALKPIFDDLANELWQEVTIK